MTPSYRQRRALARHGNGLAAIFVAGLFALTAYAAVVLSTPTPSALVARPLDDRFTVTCDGWDWDYTGDLNDGFKIVEEKACVRWDVHRTR